PAAQAILAKTRDELLGRVLRDVFPAGTGTPLEESCRRAMAESKTVSLEHQLENSQTWCAVTAIPDATGGIVARFSNITRQKRLENTLRTSREKFAKAFHSNPAPMSIVDLEKNGAFVEINEAFERITGYSQNEVIGRTSSELGLYDDRQDLAASRKRLLAE